MSLLLDALKKAAQQKAAKTKDDEPGSGAGSPDETALDVSADGSPEGGAEDGLIPRHQLEDETELDHSEIDTRLEHLRSGVEDGTETGLDIADATETRTLAPGQTQSGEDQTLIFAHDDVADTRVPAPGQAQSGEDETLIFAEDDATEAVDDQTGLSRHAAGDETDLSQLTVSEQDATQLDERTGGGSPVSEDTDLRRPVQPQDRSDTQLTARGGDETDLSASASTGGSASREDDTGPSDDDMSLLLIEREQTQLTSPTSVTDPQQPQDALRALKDEAPTAADLGLVDTTQHRLGEERTSATDTVQNRTRSSDTATTGLATPTRARPAPHPDDVTGTQTYAPDNYDRTLMRLPNDDASKLFAGMKSDSDVVMTPDYAKQVFRSKSSAQRVQHYKFYGGIAIVILLGIGVYGVFQYQAETEIIDSSLRPLKNDPMPGIIRTESGEPKADPLVTEAEINERALEIIQNAEQDEPVSAEPKPADGGGTAAQAQPEKPAADREPSASEMAATKAGQQSAPKMAEAGPAQAGESADSQSSISGVIASAGERASGGGTPSNLKIQTASRLEEKQLLLRQGYEAYQSGNDTLALQRYSRVLEIDPGNRNALLARAAIRVQNGNGAAAIEDYQTLLLANPKDSLAMASLIAVANYSPRETETQLKLMIRDEPDSPYLNFALANAYGAQNRWQEAQGHYYRALQNNPDDPNYAYNLAVSLEHISQPGAAVSYYRRALENYNKGLATFSRDVVDRRLEKLAQK